MKIWILIGLILLTGCTSTILFSCENLDTGKVIEFNITRSMGGDEYHRSDADEECRERNTNMILKEI